MWNRTYASIILNYRSDLDKRSMARAFVVSLQSLIRTYLYGTISKNICFCRTVSPGYHLSRILFIIFISVAIGDV